MKVKIIKKFEIVPGRVLEPSNEIIIMLDEYAYPAIKKGFAISIDKPELNPVKKVTKVKTKDNREKK